jgi:hypothetical protein
MYRIHPELIEAIAFTRHHFNIIIHILSFLMYVFLSYVIRLLTVTGRKYRAPLHTYMSDVTRVKRST